MTNHPTKYRERCCNECGCTYTPRRGDEFYCTTLCRKTFGNRAMVRGAELYSLFMVMRYERGLAKVLGVWAIMCRLAQQWKAEDDAEREGRPSWVPAKRQLARYPVVMTAKNAAVFDHAAGKRRR